MEADAFLAWPNPMYMAPQCTQLLASMLTAGVLTHSYFVGAEFFSKLIMRVSIRGFVQLQVEISALLP